MEELQLKDVVLIVGIFANIIATMLGFVKFIGIARDAGQWSGTVNEKIENLKEADELAERRLNTHGRQIGSLRVQLAAHTGREQGKAEGS